MLNLLAQNAFDAKLLRAVRQLGRGPGGFALVAKTA
jgi:hypothetical protein